MIEYQEAAIRKLTFQKIGNEFQKITAPYSYEYDNEEEEEILKKIFLKPFSSSAATYEFAHSIDLELHPLFKLSKSIFHGGDFETVSQQILQHLKTVSKHPNIKDGDLFVVKYDDVKLNNQHYTGLGIYKIENKENFIETNANSNDEIKLDIKQGISGRKLDKACLILLTDEPYTIFVIDNGNNGNDTEYWMNEFLAVELKNDFINNTSQFLSLTKSFITEQFPEEYQTTKADQIELLNRSVQYFKKHETFDKSEFETEVLQNKNVIESFRNFDDTYREYNGIDLKDTFEISPQAVKKQARIFKSVLKLDRNFHIYIHGNTEMIQQGIDEDGRKFYKIFYQEES
ncbi:MAG: nucleoid-associated protein [Sphingobacteriales bacterium]|nr:nucleoid-associated protein [Sphingobacteriales bacterium]